MPEPLSLLSRQALADPSQVYAELRQRWPVAWSHEHGSWLVTRYADVQTALRDERLNASRRGRRLDLLAPEVRSDVRPVFAFVDTWPSWNDPPAHTRLRRLASRAFAPTTVSKLDSEVERHLDATFKRLHGQARIEVMHEVSRPIALETIRGLVGEGVGSLESWLADLMAFLTGWVTPQSAARARRSVQALNEYVAATMEATAEDRPPLIEAILMNPVDEAPASREELAGIVGQVLTGAFEPVRHAIGLAILMVVTNHELRTAVRSDAARLEQIVDEILRLASPFRWVRRIARENFVWHDQEIRLGDSIQLGIASANRDEAAFPAAEQLRIGRAGPPHLAFGLGHHYCLGAALARRQIAMTLVRAADLPVKRVAFRRLEQFGVNGLESLWLHLDEVAP